MANQKKVLIMLAVILIVGISLGFLVYTLTKPKPISPYPLLPNAPKYVCAESLPQAECAQLKLTCGNGIIDPYETCNNCAFDAGCAAGLICGRANGTQDYTCKYPVGLCITSPAG
ncbi:MAG: hypothetical protein M1503_12505 [Thaumarchaeota archaeon]|nr:hypothetical protein [Nitrososphaerota archaeon]MCL5319061.1 hypothetical protein [Nitrososphaerota archaeon]